MRRLLACLAAGAAVLGGLAVAAPPASAADSGTFSVLTYNVAGLPEAISSAPTPRESSTTTIGQRIAPYDIVNVQEDFNYHATLYAADTAHAYRTADQRRRRHRQRAQHAVRTPLRRGRLRAGRLELLHLRLR